MSADIEPKPSTAKLRETLVAPFEKKIVPNHLLSTSKYHYRFKDIFN